MRRRHVACLVPLVAVWLAGCANAAPEEGGSFYGGRTLEVVVPYGPGGGSDTWARLVAPYLQQHLGPRAAVQVLNVPGAGSVAGANEYALRRRPDGRSVLVTGPSTFLPYVLGEPAVRYEFRELTPIVASPVGAAIYVSSKLGVERVEELAALDVDLVYGGISPTGGDLLILLAFEVLGLKVRPILGYTSKGAARVAFEQGEVNIDYQTMPAYLASVTPLVESGLAVPIMTLGFVTETGELVRDPTLPDLPTVREAYIALHGKEPEGIAWEAFASMLAARIIMEKVLWVHRTAPQSAIDALRTAAGEVVATPEFREAARAEVGDYPFYVGEAAERLILSVLDPPAEVIAWIKQYLRERHGVERI